MAGKPRGVTQVKGSLPPAAARAPRAMIRRKPTLLTTVGMALAVFFATALSAGTAQAAPGDYGAIAYSESTRVASFGAGDSQESAVSASVAGCRSQGGGADCKAFIWVENGHLSVARADGGFGTAFGIAWGTSPTNALKYAVQSCEKYGGADCVEVFSVRTSDTPDESPSARGGPVSDNCPAVFLIGVRGSGETQTYGAQIDAFIDRLYPKLAAAYGASQISNNYLEYPAVGVTDIDGQRRYIGSVQRGHDSLRDELQAQYDRCGTTSEVFALAGYSQGANVIRDTLVDLEIRQSPILAKIASVTYFGDPLLIPSAPFPVIGPGSGYWGILTKLGLAPNVQELPSPPASRVMSYCLTASQTTTGLPDPICAVPVDTPVWELGDYVGKHWQGAHDRYKDVPEVLDAAADAAYTNIVNSSGAR